MKSIIYAMIFFWVICLPIYADNKKVEIIDEKLQTETKRFCSKVSERAAGSDCKKWLETQKKILGDRLLTAHCGSGETSTSASGACFYRAMGELKYVLKTKRIETIEK
ncbi:MAG: hypothetical protein HRU19_19025 [Pseudobacteriovorax sp.]|nr:hypothetical protein [Pseudobacteriovorax sp.]